MAKIKDKKPWGSIKQAKQDSLLEQHKCLLQSQHWSSRKKFSS